MYIYIYIYIHIHTYTYIHSIPFRSRPPSSGLAAGGKMISYDVWYCSLYTMLCYAMLRYAMRCYAMLYLFRSRDLHYTTVIVTLYFSLSLYLYYINFPIAAPVLRAPRPYSMLLVLYQLFVLPPSYQFVQSQYCISPSIVLALVLYQSEYQSVISPSTALVISIVSMLLVLHPSSGLAAGAGSADAPAAASRDSILNYTY